jgi:hypothetical protein
MRSEQSLALQETLEETLAFASAAMNSRFALVVRAGLVVKPVPTFKESDGGLGVSPSIGTISGIRQAVQNVG